MYIHLKYFPHQAEIVAPRQCLFVGAAISILRCLYLRFQGLDFEQKNSKSCLRPLGTTY